MPSFPQRLLLITALVASFPLLHAADDAPGSTPAVDTPQGNVTDPSKLLAALPQVPELSIEGTTVVWRGHDASVTIVGADPDSGDPLAATDIGQLHIPLHLLTDHHTEVLPAIPALIAKAKAAGLSVGSLSLQLGVLTGPSLRDKDLVVVPEGVMHKQALTASDRSGEIDRLAKAAAALTEALPSTGLDSIGCRALQEVIGKISQHDGGQAIDEIAPSFARRVVRNGYLREWFHGPGGPALVAEAEKAVVQATTAEPTSAYGDGELKSQELSDAFGSKSWVFTTSRKTCFAYEEPHPEFMGADGMPHLMVVVDLPAGANPATDAAKALDARMFDRQSNLLASWSQEKGFSADHARWRELVSLNGQALAHNVIPPHILIRSLDGVVAALAVDKGLVHPPANTTRAAAEAFLDEAARLLPDNSELDLVGEYLFAYVYPSPDAKHPDLMGNRQEKSNCQQTVWQTCGSVSGGIMHGDCADIAELYEALTKRQQLNPIIIGLPEHAACCWAEKVSDLWHICVLQTGPPLEFNDPVLPKALEKAYKLFDPSMPFDANQLPLLLRFSGENSRSAWILSWRIFSEPKYYETMADVQRDWHFETYQRGISTMKKLIADGDEDNANFTELCGLYTFTGQFDLAAEYCKKARERTDNATTRLELTMRLVGDLLGAGHQEEALAEVNDVLDKQLPPLKEKLGASELQIALELMGACLDQEGGPTLQSAAMKTEAQELYPTMSNLIDKLGGWIASSQFNIDAWNEQPQFRSLRSLTGMYSGLGIELLRKLSPTEAKEADAQSLSTAIQHYIDGIAFHDLEDNSAVMEKYDLLGRWYGLLLGQEAFDAKLEAVEPASDAHVEHAQRTSGQAQLTRDLPWIRASVPYWYQRLAELFRRDKDHLDADKVALFAKRLEEANTATVALGLTNPAYKMQEVLSREIAALAAHDRTALRQVLKEIATDNDKALRDDSAQFIGDSARFMDLAWFKQVLAAWHDEVDYKPKYFWIAWRAALNKAPKQALMVAAMAADHFKDDPAFVEEYGFMKTVLAAAADKQETATP